MKIIKRYNQLILIIFAMSLTTCDWDDQYFDIPDALRIQFHNGDTLLFYDAMSKRTDSFSVKVDYQYDRNDKKYTQHGYVTYKQLNKYKTLRGLETYQSIDTSYYSISVISYLIHYRKSGYLPEMTIKSTDYNDVFISTILRPNDTIPEAIYFSLKLGILRYDYGDGRRFERIN